MDRRKFLKVGALAGGAVLLFFGLKRSLDDIPVFISRGIGWAIYPVRFNCFPEIAVLTLTKTNESDGVV